MQTLEALKPHACSAEFAAQFLTWIRERGGLSLWRSLNLSDPGKTWTCPLTNADGSPKTKPTNYAENEPYRIITSTDDVIVPVDHEVKRFRIAVRMGRQGLSMKLTDTSTARVKREVEKAGEGAYYVFEDRFAVIMAPIPGQTMTLTEWAKANNL